MEDSEEQISMAEKTKAQCMAQDLIEPFGAIKLQE